MGRTPNYAKRAKQGPVSLVKPFKIKSRKNKRYFTILRTNFYKIFDVDIHQPVLEGSVTLVTDKKGRKKKIIR